MCPMLPVSLACPFLIAPSVYLVIPDDELSLFDIMLPTFIQVYKKIYHSSRRGCESKFVHAYMIL